MRPLFLLTLAACANLTPIAPPDLASLDATELARVELGRALFFDQGLSGSGDVACATCHDPAQYGTDGLPTSIGVTGRPLRRNAPSTFNAALKTLQFWDGRAETLEAQAREPLLAADEMGATEAQVEAHALQTYLLDFERAFPGESSPTFDQVTMALASYQRHLPSPSRADDFVAGDASALSALEQEGMALYRGNCAFCHGGQGIGGTRLEVLGEEVPWPEDRAHDLGRQEVTGNPADRLVFVIPSLRNVSHTGPWFHDGSVETLEEAVRLMAKHQVGVTFRDDEVQALVAFLGSLEARDVPAWAWAP